ncbi:Uncharacterized conserved protein, DUF2267 family [Tistlia consotensis]|uniref:Uncharacterized conserved protein, DUF2267 family n=1 Tax=Tistlia consotensis USBA 355 TaxID=560819 RepID=A0A1Y6CNV2_9PROT|nr:DUF2267 domain-containing protein [Tistlia consotensis]SMF79845.1 Uncharacterized conserved protein, DUF2267 family [Tistlia consotensis USBA 355]SNS16367.1 Uncharacterized conserved protein, DUF2267 family [Tistlia consotensis]
MSGCGLHVFDGALQDANLWLKAVMTHLDTPDAQLALTALRGTLHALRDRIGPENAAHLGAQLPTLVRGLYYEGWHPDRAPSRERHKQAFVEHVRRDMPDRLPLDAEAAARAVCFVIWEKLDPGAVCKLMHILPEELHDLWPERAQVRAQQRA